MHIQLLSAVASLLERTSGVLDVAATRIRVFIAEDESEVEETTDEFVGTVTLSETARRMVDDGMQRPIIRNPDEQKPLAGSLKARSGGHR